MSVKMTRGEKMAILIVAVIAMVAVGIAVLRCQAPVTVTDTINPDSIIAATVDTTKTYRADSVHRERKKHKSHHTAKSAKQKTVKQKTTPRDMTLTPDEESAKN